MKIQYAVHTANPDGSFGERWKAMPGVPADKQTEFYDEKEAAEVAILESLRLGKLTGAFADYVIVPYDEQKNMLEMVDDKDQKAAAADATFLAKSNNDVRTAVSTMLAARQLYMLGANELAMILEEATVPVAEEELGEGKATHRPPHPLTIEIMTQAASDQGQKPFNQIDVFEGMTHTVLPWLKKRIEHNTQQDIVDREKEKEENRKARLATLVPIGFNYSPAEPPGLVRNKALVLVGYAPAVQFLLAYAIERALVAKDEKHPNRVFSVIQFADDFKVKPSTNERLVVVGRAAWQGCTKSRKTLSLMVHDHIAPQIAFAPDLLVVDDLGAVDPSGIITSGAPQRVGGPAPFRCAEGHKKLGDWMKLNDMAGLFGVPVYDESLTPDLNRPEWERLRTHAVLRPVSVIRKADDLKPGKMRIVIGRDASSIDVDAALLEPKSQIIIPE